MSRNPWLPQVFGEQHATRTPIYERFTASNASNVRALLDRHKLSTFPPTCRPGNRKVKMTGTIRRERAAVKIIWCPAELPRSGARQNGLAAT